MRFSHRSELPWWVMWPLAVLTSPVWLLFIAALLFVHYVEPVIRDMKRALLGPRVGEWQRWFAWHPVALDGGWGDTIWLETVERQAIGSSYNFGIVYQLPSPHTLTNEDRG
jgi:hypothetical protein